MESTGRLTVRVYVSQAQIPVEGATVVVTAPGEGGRLRLLSVQATDSSGEIRPIDIAAPALAGSEFPHVWAEHPGYAMLEAAGVQIFPGVETVQTMELLPLSRGQSSLERLDVREITPQSL